MKSVPCIFLCLLCFLLGACGRSANSIQIGGNQVAGSPIRLTKNSLYINPDLLGIDPDENVTISTSSDNEITFDISRDADERPRQAGGAF